MPSSGSRSAGQARAQLRELLTSVIDGSGYELDDVSVTSAGRRSVIRVIVDGEDGVDLDAIAEVSRRVSEALDADRAGFAGPYVLEVSSPGVDRPLTQPRHWRRAAGRLVAVPIGGPSDGEGAQAAESVSGRVIDTSESGVRLRLADGQEREYGWAALGPGRVQIEFNRAEP